MICQVDFGLVLGGRFCHSELIQLYQLYFILLYLFYLLIQLFNLTTFYFIYFTQLLLVVRYIVHYAAMFYILHVSWIYGTYIELN
jgi:hypothetical protein